jgi:hypothetical protein
MSAGAIEQALREHLATCERVVQAGEGVIPSWRIATGEGEFLILTRFHPDQMDATFLDMLPGRVEELEPGEAKELDRIFSETGELAATRLA